MQMTPPYGRKWRASYWRWRWEWKSWLKTLHSENKDHGIWSHHFITNRWGNSGNSDRLYFLGLHEIKRCLLLGRISTKYYIHMIFYKTSWLMCNSSTTGKATRVSKIKLSEIGIFINLFHNPWNIKEPYITFFTFEFP